MTISTFRSKFFIFMLFFDRCLFILCAFIPYTFICLGHSIMEFDRSLCILPSQGPPYLIEGGEKCESPPRALQLSSGNVRSVGSEPTFDIRKPELGHQFGREEAPSIFSTRTTHAEGSLPRAGERRRRRQRRDAGSRQYPWQRDRNFIRYELDSERYRAYRLKTRQSNDQIWPDDVEECLQYGTFPAQSRDCDHSRLMDDSSATSDTRVGT